MDSNFVEIKLILEKMLITQSDVRCEVISGEISYDPFLF